jgi:nucleotide-binding universal stress UspA family protein
MKFLLAVDGSDCSVRAVTYLADHLALFSQPPQVLLVNVQAPVASPRVQSFIGKDALESYYSEEGDAELAPARKLLDAKDINFLPVKLVGDVGKEIARYALAQQCAMVVMGTHGHGAVGNLVMGSVATRVLAECKVPVLLIK